MGTNTELSQLVLTGLKTCIAMCYLIIALVYIPRMDAATSRRKIIVIKSIFTLFIGFTIITYLHVAWFMYNNLMPMSYWAYTVYQITVALHAVVGLILVILMYPLASVRIVDSKAYSDFIDRQILIEKQRLLADMQEGNIEHIAKEAKLTYDMARLVLEAYKQ